MFETQKRIVRVANRHMGESSTLEIAQRCGYPSPLTLSCLKALEKEGKVQSKGRKWLEIPDPDPTPMVPEPISSRSDLDSEVVQTSPTFSPGCIVSLAFGVLVIFCAAIWVNLR